MAKKQARAAASPREGFTTGSAAAAAAKAAVELLLSGRDSGPEKVSIALPPFSLENRRLTPGSETRLEIPVAGAQLDGIAGIASAAVIKDSGDDPDVTDKIRIEVSASLRPENFNGYAESFPEDWLVLAENIHQKTGPGIGRVTLPGLAAPPGEPAVNPEPRKQIAFAAREAALSRGYNGPLYLFLQAPQGRDMAKATLNSRLGIYGGISILGTHGLVRPYSHEAWQNAIIQALEVARALNLDTAAFCTGRRSESALAGQLPALPPQAFIQAADYAAFAVLEGQKRRFDKLIWACYPGKLLKLAQGLTCTHAGSAPADLDLLALWAGQCGAGGGLRAQISALPTVQGIFELLERTDAGLCARLLNFTAKTALDTLQAWLGQNPLPSLLALYVFKNYNSLWLKLELPRHRAFQV
jgi:cobalt-precorrin-5B (C1)-methyltransferase